MELPLALGNASLTQMERFPSTGHAGQTTATHTPAYICPPPDTPPKESARVVRVAMFNDPARPTPPDGELMQESGSVLPNSVIDRIEDLSSEFVDYPDDIAELGMKYYRGCLDG